MIGGGDIASDLDNLTIADPAVNRSQKSDRDAGEWVPARHGRVVRGPGHRRQAGIRVVGRPGGTRCAGGIARRRRGATELRGRGHHVADSSGSGNMKRDPVAT